MFGNFVITLIADILLKVALNPKNKNKKFVLNFTFRLKPLFHYDVGS